MGLLVIRKSTWLFLLFGDGGVVVVDSGGGGRGGHGVCCHKYIVV